jgi:prepilin-type processing-associated H-X9-DG protein
MIKIQRFQIYELVAALVLVLLCGFLLFTLPKKHRTKARYWNCSMVMKQLGTAAVLYTGDNAGNYPGPQPLGQKNTLVSWDRLLGIQVGANIKVDESVANLTMTPPHAAYKTLRTFTCPDDPLCEGARIVPAVPGSLDDGLAKGTGICRSYTLNLGSGNLAGQEDGISATANAIPAAKIEVAAGTVYLIENHGYATVFGQRNIANDTTIVCTKKGKLMPADVCTNPSAPMHGTRAMPRTNALMYDGHVELLEEVTVTGNGGQVMQIVKGDVIPVPPVK